MVSQFLAQTVDSIKQGYFIFEGFIPGQYKKFTNNLFYKDSKSINFENYETF